MFFVCFPFGLNVPVRERGLVAFIILALVLYRLVLSQVFPDLRAAPLEYLQNQTPGIETTAIAIQSLFTPLFPHNLRDGGQILCLFMATLFMLAFWLLFGVALENRLGRAGLAFFYLLGGALGAAICTVPFFGVSGLFWLGHASLLFCMGASYYLFAGSDMQFHYVLWTLFRGSTGVWQLPVLFGLIPFHLFFIGAQSLVWFHLDAPAQPVAVHPGVIGPLTWHLAIPVLGALAAALWTRTVARPRPAQT